MDTLLAMLNLTADLLRVWLPYALVLAVAFVLIRFTAKTVRTARRNAQIRATRRAREAYRAPVIDITDRIAARNQQPVA